MRYVEKGFEIVIIILFLMLGLAGCSKNTVTETMLPASEFYEKPYDIEEATVSITDSEEKEIEVEADAEEQKTEELKVEETGTVETVDSGIYTFYNEETECYLSYEERNLILSETPSDWTLSKVREEAFFVYAKDTGLVLDIDNARVAEGTTVKIWDLTGYDVQIWNFNQNENGTYSIAYSGNNQYCLGFDNGNATLQLRDEFNPMQEWKLVNITDTVPKQYLSFKSTGGVIEIQLPLDILNVISETRLQQWADDLETAYYSFYELTNFTPYDYIIVEAYKPSEHIGWVINNSNIIHIDNTFIYTDLQKMAARDCDWNFCALHEMGHMFDFGRPWNFESEMLTDLKLAYVLEQNGAAAAPSEFKATDNFYGADIIKAYDILGSDFSEEYDIFGCTKRFLEIKEDIGWEPFKQTFHYMQANEAGYAGISKEQKLENFVEILSDYGNIDVKSYFSDREWNAIVNKLNN